MEDLSVESAKKGLESIPWCRHILEDTSLVASVRPARNFKAAAGGGALLADTFCTQDTIPLYLMLYRPPRAGEDASVRQVQCILKLGSGLNGFPGTCHGGAVATIMDELMGEIIPVNLKHGGIPPTWYMTAYLNTRFLKPVKTPSTILAVAKLVKRDGKKLYIEGTIEDGEGTVLAKGESLYVGLKKESAKI